MSTEYDSEKSYFRLKSSTDNRVPGRAPASRRPLTGLYPAGSTELLSVTTLLTNLRTMATLMLMIDAGDKMCWRHFQDFGDGFDRFRHQQPLSFNISVGYQHSKDFTNVEILSATPKNYHQHKAIKIYVVVDLYLAFYFSLFILKWPNRRSLKYYVKL